MFPKFTIANLRQLVKPDHLAVFCKMYNIDPSDLSKEVEKENDDKSDKSIEEPLKFNSQ
jgi:hypothetical protein